MSSGKRYKFQGSSFAVQTGLGTSHPISAITQADPPVVTAAAHGLVDNDVAYLSNIPGMTELDDSTQVVDQLSSSTFSLVDVDATAYAAFVAESPNIAAVQKVTFTEFCELTAFNQQDAAADEIDVTTICSTQKEFEVGLSDSGSLTLEYNYAGNEPVQAALRAAKIAGTTVAFKIILPNSGGILIMFGSVQQQGISAGNGDVYKGTATIRLTGQLYSLTA